MKEKNPARLVPLAGVAFAVLTIAGYLTIGAFPDSDSSIGKLTGFYAAHHGNVASGGMILGWAAICFAVFGASVWARIRASDLHPVVGGIALLGIAAATAGRVSAAGAYAILGEIGSRQTIAPAALQAWHVDGAAGYLDGGSVLFLLAFAVAGIAGRVFPRWLAWPAVVLAVLQFTPLGFAASLAGLLWAAAAGSAMTLRPDVSTSSTAASADRRTEPALGRS